MVKEQCVICIDNSEWMRNGDYNPTRMSAQQDAANLLCGRKTQANPETTLAILTMAGSAPSVQVALTTDLGQLLKSLSQIRINGYINFSTSIKVAQLALKRRSSEQSSNKRIVAFIGSPLQESKEDLEKLGLRLKKNNIAVDIINFGEQEENTAKLDVFINSVNSADNSHLVTIPPGPHILADLLLTSPILYSGGGSGGDGATGGGDTGDFEFGFDPSLDPELAMVLRMSMEEENRRQERLRQEQEGTGQATSTTTEPTTTATQPTSSQQQQQQEFDEDVEMDEDEALREAIRMSLADQGGAPTEDTKQDEDEDEEMDEAEALRLAMEMSKQDQTGDNDENIADILQDEDYVNNLLNNIKKDDDKKKE